MHPIAAMGNYRQIDIPLEMFVKEKRAQKTTTDSVSNHDIENTASGVENFWNTYIFFSPQPTKWAKS